MSLICPHCEEVKCDDDCPFKEAREAEFGVTVKSHGDGVPIEIVDLMLKALSTASEVGEIKFRTCYLSKGANEEIEEALTAYRSWLSSQQGQKL